MIHKIRGCSAVKSRRADSLYSPASPPIRVLIADPQEVVRIGLRSILEAEPDFVVLGETTTLTDTLLKARHSNVDVVLLESEFSDGSGADACRRLREDNPSIRVIMLTMSNVQATFHAAVEAGVHGYVLKDVDCAELIRSIRVVAKGASYLHPNMVNEMFTMLKDGREPDRGLGLRRLSPQESRIWPLVAEGKTNKEIAEGLSLSDKTVKNYLRNMFRKLQITRRSQAATLYMQTQQHLR